MSEVLRRTIHQIRELSEGISYEMQNEGDKLLALQLLLDRLAEASPSPELTRLQKRLDRVRELRNIMELGSLNIEIRREIDEAWRRLP